MADVEQPGGGADAMDFVLYLFVLGPMVEFCLKSKRVNKDNDRRRGIALAILVLATVAAIKVSIDLSTREPNYFELLEVHSAATGAEIKRAYKTKSLEMHPDKNPEDPNAQDRFTQMRAGACPLGARRAAALLWAEPPSVCGVHAALTPAAPRHRARRHRHRRRAARAQRTRCSTMRGCATSTTNSASGASTRTRRTRRVGCTWGWPSST